LRIEIADVTALGPDPRIDRAIDQRRPARSQRFGESIREALRIGGVVAVAAECPDQLLVVRVLHQHGRSGVGVTAAVDVIAPIDAAIIEDDGDDRQPIPADGFDLHSAEPESAVTFDRHDGFAAGDGGGNRKAHADAHYPPRSASPYPTRRSALD
jgi:hypothetical protein